MQLDAFDFLEPTHSLHLTHLALGGATSPTLSGGGPRLFANAASSSVYSCLKVSPAVCRVCLILPPIGQILLQEILRILGFAKMEIARYYEPHRSADHIKPHSRPGRYQSKGRQFYHTKMLSSILLAALSLLASQPVRAATSCKKDIYLDVLDAFPSKASSYCPYVEATPTITQLPGWLSAFDGEIKDLESACSCFLSTSITLAPTPSSSGTSSAPSVARTTAPAGAVIVSQSGEEGTYGTVQAGVDALSVNQTGEQFLFIYPGVYTEQVVSRNLTAFDRH